MVIQKKIFNPYCKTCELKREHYCNGTFEKGIPKCGGLMSTFKDIKPRTTKQTRFDWCEA